MLSHQRKRIAWKCVLVVCLGGLAVPAQGAQPATIADAVPGVSSPQVAVREAPVPTVVDGAPAPGVDPNIERGSRGVARNLLVAGIAVAGVIAVLSGVFAFRHKKQ